MPRQATRRGVAYMAASQSEPARRRLSHAIGCEYKMTPRSKLRAALSERLVPALLSRGFEGPRAIAGNALLHEYRRRTPHGTHVITVQLEKHGLPRFLLSFYVEPAEGMAKISTDGGVVISGQLKPGPGGSSRSWFRADRSWWERVILRKHGTLEREAAGSCVSMLGEVDAWWSNQAPSAHISAWPVEYPGPKNVGTQSSRT